VSRFQFVADHRHAFEVKRLCAIVGVARSSFYAWREAAPRRAARAAADAELAERIRTFHEADHTQGAPRITAELNDGVAHEQRVNRKRVARVMREHADPRHRPHPGREDPRTYQRGRAIPDPPPLRQLLGHRADRGLQW